jgi:hypothetical protein
MTEKKISLEVPVEYLKSYNKDQLATVIKSQANISGFILDGKVVSKEEFEEIVDTYVSKVNGGKNELIGIMRALSEKIVEKTSMGQKVEKPSTSKQESDHGNHSKFKVLDSNLPKFGGNVGKNLEEWVLVIQGYLEMGNYNSMEALLAVLPLLKDNALQQFIAFRRNYPYDGWMFFVEHLRKVFKPFDMDRRTRIELRQLKYNGNFDKFAMKFQQLANKLGDMPEKELIFLFLEALPSKTRYEVLSKDVKKLADAIRYASIFEECCRDNQSHNEHRVNYSNFQRRRDSFDREAIIISKMKKRFKKRTDRK